MASTGRGGGYMRRFEDRERRESIRRAWFHSFQWFIRPCDAVPTPTLEHSYTPSLSNKTGAHRVVGLEQTLIPKNNWRRWLAPFYPAQRRH